VTESNRKLRRILYVLSAAVASVLVWGCAVSKTTVTKPSGPPATLLAATKPELIARYNRQAEVVTSLNATVTMTLTAGSTYTGVIKQYHQIGGFILAQKPSSIRVIGQAPVVGTNIFDMVSDGETFHIWIPSQNKFITGPTNLERPSAKPIENLRPQHLTGAIFWQAVPLSAPLLLEETSDATAGYYVLTVVRRAGKNDATEQGDWEIERKIWLDRSDLNVARVQTYDPGGAIGSDVQYSKWDTFGAVMYPRQIALARPGNDYKLQIGITKLTLNGVVQPEGFVLKQPPDAELVNAGEESQEAKPPEKNP
jgi:outer membrane lipoprotein-sorting protein